VQSRWYALIQQNGLYERRGTVTLHFYILQDGRAKHGVQENSAGRFWIVCQKAVVDSRIRAVAGNLRMLIGNDPREVNFTFYY